MLVYCSWVLDTEFGILTNLTLTQVKCRQKGSKRKKKNRVSINTIQHVVILLYLMFMAFSIRYTNPAVSEMGKNILLMCQRVWMSFDFRFSVFLTCSAKLNDISRRVRLIIYLFYPFTDGNINKRTPSSTDSSHPIKNKNL